MEIQTIHLIKNTNVADFDAEKNMNFTRKKSFIELSYLDTTTSTNKDLLKYEKAIILNDLN